MDLWKTLGDVAAVFLIMLIVLLIISAIVTAVIVIGGIIAVTKDQVREMQMEKLRDKIVEQAAAGLKEREERNEET